MTKYWIIVASKDHVNIGVNGGFAQANHGKQAPMKKLTKGDKIIFYSSKEKLGDEKPYQKFTAIGQVIDDEEYVGFMSDNNFKPYRRNIEFYKSNESDIKPLIEKLEFIPNKSKWGFPFRFGFFEISENDFNLIKNSMI
jgi:predicted RNA-binding protein